MKKTGNTLFLVEDDDAVRTITCQMLSRLGWSVISAATGHEALCRLSGEHFDARLAMVDIHLPDMGGDTVYRHLQLFHRSVPVVFSSGYDREDPAVIDLLGSCREAYLQKPFSLETLKAVLEAFARDVPES